MRAAPGVDLLDWLARFTFAEERLYRSESHAQRPPTSSKVLDDARSGAADSADLIDTWHRRGRLRYATTLRFTVTSTEAQLCATGELCRQHPDCLMQTYSSESASEIEFVRKQFPKRVDYTDVNDHFGLLGPRSLFRLAFICPSANCIASTFPRRLLCIVRHLTTSWAPVCSTLDTLEMRADRSRSPLTLVEKQPIRCCRDSVKRTRSRCSKVVNSVRLRRFT